MVQSRQSTLREKINIFSLKKKKIYYIEKYNNNENLKD